MNHGFDLNTVADAQALVLIAEDEPEIVDILRAYLAREGFRSAWAADGRAALEMHLSLKPDLLLLDVQMPRVDGWQVLSEVRARGQTPVIMVTAHDQDIDKLMALRIGADDYVVKPFNPAEVAARVRAVLRRTRHVEQDRREVLRVAPLEIDLEAFRATVVSSDAARHILTLTLTEFRLLAHLARAPRRVFSRAELIAACLPEGEVLERTVDSHISKLRRKLEDVGVEGMPASLRGVGYRLEELS
ncbi:MAG: response regulator [Opitutaceae bacterium]|nr:response regulator [Opitutaceae bacterium]